MGCVFTNAPQIKKHPPPNTIRVRSSSSSSCCSGLPIQAGWRPLRRRSGLQTLVGKELSSHCHGLPTHVGTGPAALCWARCRRKRPRGLNGREEVRTEATSTNLNNPLVFNNTAFVQKPPPATDLPLSQSGPAGVAALKFIVEPLLRPPDPGSAGSFAAPPWPPHPGGDGAFKSPLWPPDPGGVWASMSPSWPPDPGKVAERQLLGRGG